MDKEVEHAFRTGVEQAWAALQESLALQGLGLEDDESDAASDILYKWDKMIGEFNYLYVDIAKHLGIERWYD